MNAHLFFGPGANDVVAVSQAAVRVDKIFWDNEDGDALGPGRIPFDAGQDRVNDVFAKIVFTVGDEYLVAGKGIRGTLLRSFVPR